MTDQELQMLMAFAAAKKGNKNVSGVLGNLDSPMLAVLAGAYDPRTAGGAQGGGGPFWSKYSQSQDPVIQDIIGKISQGFDKYQLNSYIDSLAAQGQDLGSFQVSDLKGVAASLQKEYVDGPSTSGGASSKDPFSKAGLPSPTELYDTSTVPLSAPNSKHIKDIQDKLKLDMAGYANAGYDAEIARRNLGRGLTSEQGLKTVKKSDIEKWIKEAKSNNKKGFLDIQQSALGRLKKKNDIISLSDLSSVFESATTGVDKYTEGNKGWADTTKMLVKDVTNKARKSKKTPTGYNKEASKAYDDAMFKKAMGETISVSARQREEAIRQGQMDYAQQSGATPSTDAMKQILKFIAATK